MTMQQEDTPLESRPYTWLLLGVLGLGLVLRVLAAMWWETRLAEGQRFFFGDSLGYEILARQLARGEDFAYGTAYVTRTPGYPLLLAPFYWWGDHPPTLALRMVGVFCGTAAIGLAAWLGQLLFDRRVGLVAALLVALYPGGIAMSVFVLAEAPFAPLMLLTLGLMIMALRREKFSEQIGWGAATGVVFGLAILVRPSWLMFPLFAVPIGLALYGQRQRQLAIYAAAGLAAAVVMAPWWVRNYVVVGQFVPTTLQVGASLYDGLGPQATGASDMQFVQQFEERLLQIEAQAESPLPGTHESRRDALMKQAAIEWTLENPGEALKLAGVKLWRYWTPWGNDSDIRGKMAWVIAAGYLPIVLTGLAGAVYFAPRGWTYALLALPLIYFCLLHLIFVSSIRYRQPPMLALAVLSAALLVLLWQKMRSKRSA